MNRLRQQRPRRGTAVVAAMGGAAVLFVFWSWHERERSIRLASTVGVFEVSLASTPEQRAAGLSNLEAIPYDGLLLQWNSPGRHPIWMSEMRFALDLVWLDANGGVLSVLPNVPPCASVPCPLYEPAGSEKSVAVLELPAGKAGALGLFVGAIVRRD